MRWAIGALGALLCVAGAVVFALADRAAPDGGWFAYTASYAPLPTTAYRSQLVLTDGSSVLWSEWHLAGAAVVVVGLLVLTGLAGWTLGRRTATADRAVD